MYPLKTTGIPTNNLGMDKQFCRENMYGNPCPQTGALENCKGKSKFKPFIRDLDLENQAIHLLWKNYLILLL